LTQQVGHEGRPDEGRFLEVAVETARAAGALLRERLGRVRAEYKSSRTDLVTEADRASEALILHRLREAFPQHAFWGEESGQGGAGGGGGYRWLVDPLDGTTNYVHGLPIFAVSIALERQGELVVGVVYQPVTEELFTAVRGRGAWLNGEPIRVSSVDRLEESLLVTGFPYDAEAAGGDNMDHFVQFSRRCHAVRRLGSAALDLAYVAAGRFDAYWEVGVNPWDWGAGVLLVQEAGGRVTDFRGRPLALQRRQVVASNGRIHDRVLEVLRLGTTGWREG